MSDEDTILPTGPINPVIFMNINDLLDNVKEMWIAMTPYYIKSLCEGLPKCIGTAYMLMDVSQVLKYLGKLECFFKLDWFSWW